jgi:hypothetical protein
VKGKAPPTDQEIKVLEMQINLTAPQADCLEDALLTFLPEDQRPDITGRKDKGLGQFYAATIAPDQLPQAVAALQSYREQISPKSRTVAGLLRLIGGVA